MMQSAAGPDHHLDGATAGRDGRVEAPDAGGKPAQREWGRYGGSPGGIPMATTLRLARRATRLSADRLLPLADVLRRWVPPESSTPSAPVVLTHARPAATAFPGGAP